MKQEIGSLQNNHETSFKKRIKKEKKKNLSLIIEFKNGKEISGQKVQQEEQEEEKRGSGSMVTNLVIQKGEKFHYFE